MKELDLLEATRLSIYFEELAAHHYRERKKLENQPHSTPHSSEVVEFELGNAEEYNDPEWWKDEEEEDNEWLR